MDLAKYYTIIGVLCIFGLFSCHSPASMSAYAAASGKPTQVSAPVASPAPGFSSTTQTVVLSSATSGVSIYYTLDGSSPASGTLYTGSFAVSTNSTLRAQAFKSGFPDSAELDGYYQIGAATPTFQITTTDANGTVQTLNPGSAYTSANDITSIKILYNTLSTNSENPTIIYTTGGLDPTVGTNYRLSYTFGDSVGTLINGQSLVVKAYAHVPNWTDSPIATTTLSVVYTTTHVPVADTPVTLAIVGASGFNLSSGATYTLTATDYDGNTVIPTHYQWYLNSITVGTGSSLTIDSSTLVNGDVSLAAGQYTLSCVAVCNGSTYSQSKVITIN